MSEDSSSIHGASRESEFGTSSITAHAIAGLYTGCVVAEAELKRLHKHCTSLEREIIWLKAGQNERDGLRVKLTETEHLLSLCRAETDNLSGVGLIGKLRCMNSKLREERDDARQHARIHGMQVAALQHEVDNLKQNVGDLTAGNSELCRRLEIAKYELAAARRTKEIL